MEDQLQRYLRAGAWSAYWDPPEEVSRPAQLGQLDELGRCILRVPGKVLPGRLSTLRIHTPRWDLSMELDLLTIHPEGTDTVLGVSLNDWHGIQRTLRAHLAAGDARRQHPRELTPLGEVRWVRIRREGSETWTEAEMLDLSAGGLRVRAPTRLAHFLTVGAAMRIQTLPLHGLPGQTLHTRVRHLSNTEGEGLTEATLDFRQKTAKIHWNT